MSSRAAERPSPPRGASTPPEASAAALQTRGAVAFLTPALLLIAVFLVFPALWTLYLGITDYRLTGIQAAQPQVIGLDNYASALGDPAFANSLWVTLLYVLGSAVVGQLGLGFALAWTFRRWRGPARNALEVLVIAAWIIPSSVVAFLWIAFLDTHNGTLNAALGNADIPWLFSWPLLSIVVFNTWRGTAFSMLLCGGALNTLPPSHLETARLAGASTWQQLRDIVLPSIRGHLLTNLLLISLWTFNDFTPYLITAGGPNFATDTLPVYIFRNALINFQLGYGAAISAILLLINLVIALVYLRLLRARS
jgi:multiple sugar transport system permease protein